ncbi:hypothetical protein [uncultured Methylobacterium sp.]|uniref:hypothetical protein n=1 Tax=uncultured Methylobacterium sp. TaxID=157278 RepID=UPI002584E761|nr:hypothetical protein [uncultured Methylobacterium sp.]
MKKILIQMFFVFSCVVVFGSALLDLIRDTAHRGQWVATAEWVAEDAGCHRIAFVLSSCSVKAVRRDRSRESERDLQYFTFANWGGEDAELVRSARDPEVVALRQAAEGLGGRWAVVFALLGCVVWSSWKAYCSRLPGVNAPDRSGEATAGGLPMNPAGPGKSDQRATFGQRKTFGQRGVGPPRRR